MLLNWSTLGGVASFFGFAHFNWNLSPKFSANWCSSGYGSLTREQRLEWDARVGSSVHAVFCCLVCLVCWLCQPVSLFNDPKNLGGSWWFLTAAMVVMAGYMLADCVGMLAYMTWKEMGPYLLHHCVAMICFLYCTHYGMLQYFVLFRLISEVSTPFVNLMWFFRISGYRNRAPMLNSVNSLVLAVSFAAGRIVLVPFYWIKVVTFLTGSGKFFIFRFPITFALWTLFSGLLDVLNIIWFQRILIGGLKVWRGSRKVKTDGPTVDAASNGVASSPTQ
ncbi:hypothetical protein BOX15_Mlig001631g2 [Macrostomum lignano]|uniref:TLC domain-containing protein n=1 Tax=Macrostomum lignano TaxID=282301 RepID=A0A267HA41_9PLAT|nr:hypothetical protein BOX15_Mlig001631g2 [Macrostomum lignano]